MPQHRIEVSAVVFSCGRATGYSIIAKDTSPDSEAHTCDSSGCCDSHLFCVLVPVLCVRFELRMRVPFLNFIAVYFLFLFFIPLSVYYCKT